MKKSKFVIRLTIQCFCIMFLFSITNCVTTNNKGNQINQAQHNAQMRTIGRGIAAALVMIEPEAAVKAHGYCRYASQVNNAMDAKTTVLDALTYFLNKKYSKNAALTTAVMDALIAIGMPNESIDKILEVGAVTSKDLPEMNEATIRDIQMIIQGFCSMITFQP